MFGMGNWKDIAEHVATKSDKKCEKHYLTAYLGWKDLMPRFIGDSTEVAEDKDKEGKDKQPSTDEKAAEMNAASDHVLRGPPGERNGPSQLAGYMPLRGDFDVEYDNEAEMILADMEFSEADHPTERELKLKVIQIYNQKLEKRTERKKFVVERGLLDYKLHQHTERKRPKEERELLAQVRPFARFQSPEEHDNFVEGLIAAMRLKKQILLLQEYRKNGVRTLAEAELYDADKKKRELDQAIQKQRDSASYLYESGRTSSSGRDRANRWQNRDQGANGDAGGDNSRTRGAAAGAAGLNAIAATFSVEGTPGCHLLTPKEKELCSRLKLLPKVIAALLGDQGRTGSRVLPLRLPNQEDGQGDCPDRCVPRTALVEGVVAIAIADPLCRFGGSYRREQNRPGLRFLRQVRLGQVRERHAHGPKKGKKPAEAASVIAKKEEQSVTSSKPVTPAKRKAAEMEAGSGTKL
ncbi:hypothetical protein ON010_g13551 [Phytophthora cinnamomi]|nr:hypothetical protein ON010_g13551 [Phytophthora cinnamomi]